jgi:hypothetical protein
LSIARSLASARRDLIDEIKSLTAAAVRAGSGNTASQQVHGLAQDWQLRSLELYDELGVVHFPAQLFKNVLSQIRLFPAVRDENGEIEEIEDQAAADILYRIQDPGGGTAGWKGQYGLLRFLIGDGYLTCTQWSDGDDSGEAWEFLSPVELKYDVGGKRFTRNPAPSMNKLPLLAADGSITEEIQEGEIRAWRMWNPHPRHSQHADSSIRAALDLFDQLQLCSRATQARLISRLVGSGILAISDKVTLPPLEAGASDENPAEDRLLAEIMEHFITPVQTPGSAAQWAPYMLRFDNGDRPVSDFISHIAVHDPTTYPEIEVADKLIHHVGMTIDIPPEELLGLGREGNHWGAWKVDEQKFELVRPTCQALCDDLVRAYYRPALKESGHARADELTIGYDAASIVSHPDQGKDVKDAFDRGAANFAALREAVNLTDDDAPDEEEMQIFLAVKMRDASLLPDKFRPEPEPVPESLTEITEEEQSTGAQQANEVVEAPPEQLVATGGLIGPVLTPVYTSMTTSGSNSYTNGHLSERVLAAAEMGVLRTRYLAGSRIRQRSKSCPTCFEGTEEVSNADLASAMGPELVASVGCEGVSLVAGGAREFREAVTRWGLEVSKADELSEQIEQYVASTLYEQQPEISVELRDSILAACRPVP